MITDGQLDWHPDFRLIMYSKQALHAKGRHPATTSCLVINTNNNSIRAIGRRISSFPLNASNTKQLTKHKQLFATQANLCRHLNY